jgi:hypothetical protein
MGTLVVVLAAIPAGSGTAAGSDQRGALVRTTMRSTVGVVLDEIPRSMRARVAATLIAKPSSFWRARARRQLRLTGYRLVFRGAFYEKGKQALPLPPPRVWNVRLTGTPSRRRVDGHDVVAVTYSFWSVLVTDRGSPRASEPRLDRTGGRWRERFVLPLDPELVLQRSGYACMDEEDFPFASVDSEEVDSFFDQECTVEHRLSNVGQCHFTRRARESCTTALRRHVGRVQTAVVFERLAWDRARADRYRVGKVTGKDPDLQIYAPDFLPSRTTYRYIHGNGAGCEVAEGSVGGTGWRRLLQFATSDENVGERALTIGGVDYTISGHPEELEQHNLYEFSACHRHNHFRYYGELGWAGGGGPVNSKKAFCLQSTSRAANRETSPLPNAFSSCDYQGVEPGWIDQYKAGLSGQWLDTTDLPAGVGTRSFHSNPRGLLCEGAFVDHKGRRLKPREPVVWAPTGDTAANGKPVEAPLCRLRPGWDANNTRSTHEVLQPHGHGLITAPCRHGEIGPLRNCGFAMTALPGRCRPGERATVTFSVHRHAPAQVVRVTDFSHALNAPIPARYEDSYVPLRPGVADAPAMLANVVVTRAAPRRATFTCPAPRDSREPGGAYGLYTAPVFPGDRAVTVSATRESSRASRPSDMLAQSVRHSR